jgi:membrane protease YdiL (CAAX protease family)
MLTYLKNKKENWILLTGGINFSLAIVLYLIFEEPNHEVSRAFSQLSLWFFVFVAIIVAPVLEEFAFRGFFSKNRKLQFLALGLLLVFVLSSISKTYTFLPLIVMLVAFFSSRKAKNRIAFIALVISNATLFALYHYTLNDLLSLHTFFYPLFHFTIGLVLVWIVINFSLGKAIIAHSLWNSVNIAILFLVIQTPSDQVLTYTNTNGVIKWQKVKRFFNEESSVVNFNKTGLSSTKIEAIKLLKMLSGKQSSEISLEVAQKNPYYVYDIDIILIDEPKSQKEVWSLCLNLLKESYLIKEFE